MARSKVSVPVVVHEGRRVVPHYTYGARPGDVLHVQFRDAVVPRAGFVEPEPTEWVEAPRWVGPLRVTGYSGGRSSSCYAVEIAATDGLPVVGLMSCLTFRDLIGRVYGGVVSGTWSARKQGQNYMIVEAA